MTVSLNTAHNRPAVRRERRYRTYVRVMRLLLSTVVITLAASILLWPLLNEEDASFTLSYEEVSKGDDQIRMVNPRYVGVDSNGRPFEVRAAEGVQDSPDDPRILLTQIFAGLDLENELVVEARSDQGIFRFERNLLELTGEVRIRTSDGYYFEGGVASFDIENRRAWSDERISGGGPLGIFEAGRFEFVIDEHKALFEGGVSMKIDPTGQTTPPSG